MTYEELIRDFPLSLGSSNQKYRDKIPMYGASWKTVPLDFLRNRLWNEIYEWKKVSKKHGEASELNDIINIALMLAQRLQRGEND